VSCDNELNADYYHDVMKKEEDLFGFQLPHGTNLDPTNNRPTNTNVQSA
jgi:hypothetical protein